MMDAIWKKIFFFAVIPFLAVFALLSVIQALYLYETLPASVMTEALYPVLKSLAASFLTALILLSALMIYIVRSISKPLGALTASANAISGGDLDMLDMLDKDIAVSQSNDEIGMMARSLRRMAEQLRVYKEAYAVNLARDEALARVPKNAVLESDLPTTVAARGIVWLDVDKGISLSGESQANYLKLLQMSAGSLETGIARLKKFLCDDLSAFTIEVHGMKGALFGMGAEGLGGAARDLEGAAKTGDADYCARLYPAFAESISLFVRQLRSIWEGDAGTGGAGDIEELFLALSGAKAACENFDVFRALDIITPLAKLEYGAGIDGRLHEIEELLNSMEYDEATKEISELASVLEAVES
jgi:HAMP domain-containing protein